MTQGTGKPLFAKLFLEGVEVPFIGATFASNVGQATIAYIDVPPLEEIIDIKARTHVLLAVRDMNNPRQNYPFIKGWEGEVFGIQYHKTPDQRTFTISATDVTSYWDNVLLYFFNTQQSLGKGADSMAPLGQNVQNAERQNIPVQPTTHSLSSYFIEIMKSTLNQDTKDFLDALVSIYKKMENINQFYSNAEERLRISDRIKLKSSGRLEELLKAQESLEWITGIIGQDSGYSTLRQAIQKLMGLIFHDFVSVSVPSKVETAKNDSVGALINSVSKQGLSPSEFIFKPNLYMMPPPACNIFYPDEYSSFSYSRMFFQEPTRLIYKPHLPSVFSAGVYSLPHSFEPKSFQQFMRKEKPTEVGSGPLQISESVGGYGDADNNPKTKETNQGSQREFQFLTNEEKMRGILMAEENMAPGATLLKSLSETEQKSLFDGVARYLFFKKRFQSRTLAVSSHLKLSVVPGFPCLVLDPAGAKLSMVAYVNSATHRIYANQGGYTTVNLSYARTVDEQDLATTNVDEPPIPPWFDSSLFGGGSKDGENRVKYGSGISDFYGELLGSKGNRVITDLMQKDTLGDSVKALIKEYLEIKKSGGQGATSDLISRRTDRNYIKLKEAFKYLGATTNSANLNDNFLIFQGSRFSGQTGDDSEQVNLRRDVVLKYRNALIRNRGFRG